MDKEVKASEKTTWSNQVEFFLSLLGYVVGLGNLWRFPYVCYRNGGGAFLIPYLGSMLIIGLPMYVGEIGMGQYTRSGKINAWNRIPIMKGIGFGSIIMCCFSMPPYMMVMAWSLLYLGHSFNSDLPWATCGHHWN
ncbi:sodium- and chloride-dependent creatine transporter 1-like [Ciona intestinalis]